MTPETFKNFREGLDILAEYEVTVHAECDNGFPPCLGVVLKQAVRALDQARLQRLGWYLAWERNEQPYSERWDFDVDPGA